MLEISSVGLRNVFSRHMGLTPEVLTSLNIQEARERLHILAGQAVKSLEPYGSVGFAIAVDIHETHRLLDMALLAGVPFREQRAAALFNAGAVLGAAWFTDDRLLTTPLLLRVPSWKESAPELLALEHGERFRRALCREQQQRASLIYAFKMAVEADFSSPALRMLALTAFATEEHEADVTEQPSARRWLDMEIELIAAAGLAGTTAENLCLAGDMVLGLGRCVRLWEGRPGKKDQKADTAWLWEMVDGLAR